MQADWTKREYLKQHSVDMRQFMDFRESTLPNGMRIIEVYNSSGLTFTILPDRGFDIWTAHYNGIPLTWVSQGSPNPPNANAKWLEQFNGGLLTTCGLTHVGQPEFDTLTGVHRDLHGRYSGLRASEISLQQSWENSDSPREEFCGRLKAVVSQSALFGEQLRLTRTYTITLGDPIIRIMDDVVNLGDEPAPFMLLYHFNLGYPLISKGTEFLVSGDTYPYNADSEAGLDTWATYDEATPGYKEQVFYHGVNQKAGLSTAAVVNGDFGVRFDWHTNQLPYLTQWKNTRQGIYVCGIEPGNCIPEGRNSARDSKRLVMLQPGEHEQTYCMLEILDSSESIDQTRRRVQDLTENGKTVPGCHLDDFA